MSRTNATTSSSTGISSTCPAPGVHQPLVSHNTPLFPSVPLCSSVSVPHRSLVTHALRPWRPSALHMNTFPLMVTAALTRAPARSIQAPSRAPVAHGRQPSHRGCRSPRPRQRAPARSPLRRSPASARAGTRTHAHSLHTALGLPSCRTVGDLATVAPRRSHHIPAGASPPLARSPHISTLVHARRARVARPRGTRTHTCEVPPCPVWHQARRPHGFRASSAPLDFRVEHLAT